MADLKPTVSLTNINVQPLSRNDLLEWVNSTVNGNYTKIEDLCSGVAYCQLMEQLFPNCVGSKKIKTSAKLEHEHLHNLRLLQNAFTRLKFDKSIPIDRLIKGRFQDNLEFLQWFKKFYDTSNCSNSKENVASIISKPKLGAKQNSQPALNAKKMQTDRCVSPTSECVLKEQIDHFQAQIEAIKMEKECYFEKLTAIETILKITKERENDQDEDFCNKALNILYSKQSINEGD